MQDDTIPVTNYAPLGDASDRSAPGGGAEARSRPGLRRRSRTSYRSAVPADGNRPEATERTTEGEATVTPDRQSTAPLAAKDGAPELVGPAAGAPLVVDNSRGQANGKGPERHRDEEDNQPPARRRRNRQDRQDTLAAAAAARPPAVPEQEETRQVENDTIRPNDDESLSEPAVPIGTMQPFLPTQGELDRSAERESEQRTMEDQVRSSTGTDGLDPEESRRSVEGRETNPAGGERRSRPDPRGRREWRESNDARDGQRFLARDRQHERPAGARERSYQPNGREGRPNGFQRDASRESGTPRLAPREANGYREAAG
jgi:hypothetical protein